MSNMLRKLRIAFSILCGIACLLLIVLWARSQRYHDSWDVVYSSGTGMLRIVSWEGAILFAPWDFGSGSREPGFTHHEILNVQLEANHARANKPLKRFRPWRYSKHNYPTGSIERDLVLPHWFFVICSATLAAVPWLRWRFTLRVLLIATTLVALLLGAIVYAIR